MKLVEMQKQLGVQEKKVAAIVAAAKVLPSAAASDINPMDFEALDALIIHYTKVASALKRVKMDVKEIVSALA